jgi:hypothetical protein
MTVLIHLLEHFGVPSGAAIAIVVAGRKLITSVFGARGDRDYRFGSHGHPHGKRST